jgi:hypothetical protein
MFETRRTDMASKEHSDAIKRRARAQGIVPRSGIDGMRVVTAGTPLPADPPRRRTTTRTSKTSKATKSGTRQGRAELGRRLTTTEHTHAEYRSDLDAHGDRRWWDATGHQVRLADLPPAIRAAYTGRAEQYAARHR